MIINKTITSKKRVTISCRASAILISGHESRDLPYNHPGYGHAPCTGRLTAAVTSVPGTAVPFRLSFNHPQFAA